MPWPGGKEGWEVHNQPEKISKVRTTRLLWNFHKYNFYIRLL